jgi:quercetin dioxygenase-like cupin family protein
MDFQSFGKLMQSMIIPALGAAFRRFPPSFASDWHTSAIRELCVLVAGEAEYEVSDGEVRHLVPGSVLLMEDTKGKGHRSRNIGPGERVTLFVALKT